MILINKVSPFAVEAFQKDLIECILKNCGVGFISNIVIFYNNHNIVLPKNNKVNLVVKNGYSDYEIIEYCKKIYNDDIFIFSNPFVTFNNTLIHVDKKLQSVIKLDDCYIFDRNSKIDDTQSQIEKIFLSVSSNNKIVVEKKHNWIKDTTQNTSVRINNPLLSGKNKKNIERYLSKRDIKILPRIDILIVSVNYNDILPITLKSLPKEFNTTIVTSPEDKECQKICLEHEVNCVISTRIYENGASFNKGKAINDGIKSLSNKDWILILDADIVLQSNFTEILKSTDLSADTLFICKRLLIEDLETFNKWQKGEDVGKIERAKGYGYFQLFNSRKESFYSEDFLDASFSDLEFRDRFKIKKELNTQVIHLGQTSQNWTGRKTKKFIEERPFDINTYFDKIFCINLDSRPERWINVNKIFKENSIEVERFSALDGKSISDREFENLLKKYNPEKISGEVASYTGLIENKNSLACLLSHLQLIKLAKKNSYRRILIFEDDILLDRDFILKVEECSKFSWKMLYLGASQFNWNGIKIEDGFYKCKNTLGTFAYAIHHTIYDEIIEILETKKKSIDNLLPQIQMSNQNDCYVFYPNIVISDVNKSDIRGSKDMVEYANQVRWSLDNFEFNKKRKILLLPDVEGWAFDNIVKSVAKYNPYPEKIEYEILYARDIHNQNITVNIKNYDLIYVMFEAERIIPDGNNVIRGCYSAFWLENKFFTERKIAEYFKDCRGAVFANNFLKNSICKFLPENYRSVIIHDSTEENLFYPIEGVKYKEFTAIFVGNIQRKIKNYEDIVWICNQADINLITCTDVSNDELVKYYNKADICINFSTFEGGPQTFLETSLCEVPMLIRESNELGKLIPCFRGETKEEFVEIIKNLKKNRNQCKLVGREARKAVLENFTYKKTAKKFANFFLESLGETISYENEMMYQTNEKRNLTKELTIFIIRAGNNPNYKDCVDALKKQTCNFNIIEIVNVAPMSKAFQTMIDECNTEYYIQVDEDMILEDYAVEKIYESLVSSNDNISTVAHMLRDYHLDFNIYGIKGYKHTILKNYPYNLEIISCEVEQMQRLQANGYETLMYGDVVGLHSPKWTNELIFERYFDLMEKWKVFKYDWLDELPSKLLQIFQNDNSEINLYALMGAMSSISNKEPIRKREKNFLLKDENFDRINTLLSKKEFKYIKNHDVINAPQVLDKNYVKK